MAKAASLAHGERSGASDQAAVRFGIGARQRAEQLRARGDPELREDLVQVPLHGPRAEEESLADLRVGQRIAGQPGDLPLLRGELVARVSTRLADGFAAPPGAGPAPPPRTPPPP